MTITKITTHVDDAAARMLEQYKGKPLFTGTLGAFSTQAQNAEDALFDVLTGRAITAAVGAQLDAIGTIVALTRPLGTSDTIYRLLLYAKIGINVSQGETERVIDVYRLVTQATHVDLQEYFPAAIGIYSNGVLPDPSLVNLLSHFVKDVVSAGVRVSHFGYYDATNAFAMAGGGDGAGFGNALDASVGGILGALYAPTVPQFAFAGDDANRDVTGFGDLVDAVVGGQLQSL